MAGEASFTIGAPTIDSSAPGPTADFSYGGIDPETWRKWSDISALPYAAPTWSDYGHIFAESGLHIASGLAAGASSYERSAGNDDTADQYSSYAKQLADAAKGHGDAISPNARSNIDNSILSGRFASHPFSSTMLKITQQAPGMAAIAGAGLVGGVPGEIGAGAIMGWASYADAMHSKVFDTPDTNLRNENSQYDQWRAGGMSETDAKSRLADQMFTANHGDLVSGLIGGAAGAVGPAGQLVGGPAGLFGREAATWYGRMGQGGMESALVGAGQSALTDLASGVTERQYNLDEGMTGYDIAKGALETGIGFGLFGAAGAGVGRLLERGRTQVEGRDKTITPPVAGDTRDPIRPPQRPADQLGNEITGDQTTSAADQGKKQEADDKRNKPVAGENVGIPSARGGRKPITFPGVEEARPTDTGKPPAEGVVSDDQAAALKAALPSDEEKAPPTTDSGAQAAPTIDKEQTVPETRATLEEQFAALGNDKREAVQVLPNSDIPHSAIDLMRGDKTIHLVGLDDGSKLFYRTDGPNELTPAKAKELDAQGRLNEILGLGPHSQEDIIAREQAGEQPVAITERKPDGTEVKTAAGTTETAPDQLAALEDTKLHPDNTVQAEDPRQVITDRIQGAEGPPERIQSAAIVTDDGKVFTGTNHIFALQEAEKAGYDINRIRKTDGFITSNGRYVDRVEARNIAEGQQQIIDRRMEHPTELQAHQLWPIYGDETTVPTPAGLAETAGIERAGLPAIIGEPTEAEAPAVKTKKGKAYIAKRTSDNNVATEAMNLHPPTDMDARALLPDEEGGVGARNIVRARLQAMVDYAESRGVTIPKLFREPKTDLPPHADAQLLLREAKDFLSRAAPDTKEYERFLMRENDIRQGRREDVLKERIREAEEAKAAKEKVGPRAGAVGEEALEKVAEPAKEAEPTEEEKQDALRKLGEKIKAKLAEDPYGPWREQLLEQGKKLGITPERLKEMVDRLTKEGEAEAEIKQDGTVKTTGGYISPHSTSTVGELGPDLVLKGFKPGMRAAANKLLDMIMKVAKDVPVHMVNSEEFEKIPGNERANGLYDARYDHIIINSDRETDTTLFHEMFHAATVRAILGNRNLRNLIDRLHQEADPDEEFGNSIEFLTHLMTDPRVQDVFGNRRISDQLANDLDIPKWRRHTVFESMLAAIRKAFGLEPRETGVIEAALALTEKTLPQRELAKAPKENLPEVFYQRDFTPKRAENQDDKLVTRLKSSTANMYRGGRTAIGDTMWTKGLSLLPTSTIRSWFENHFSEGTMRRAQEGLERAGTLVRQKLKETDLKLRRLTALHWTAPETHRELVRLMQDSSAMRVHADQVLGEGDNAHLRLRQEGKEAQTNLRYMQGYDAHPELYDRFERLGKMKNGEDAQQLYKDWRDVGKAQLEGDVDATEFKIAHMEQRSLGKDEQLQDIIRRGRMGVTLTPREQTKYDRYQVLAKVIAGGKLDDDELKAFGKDRTIKALMNLRDVKNHKGPYFPSTRFGDYVVTAKHDFATPEKGVRLSGDESHHVVFKTREDMFDALGEIRSKQIQKYNKANPNDQMMDRLYAEPEIRYFAADPTKPLPPPDEREYVEKGEAVKGPYKVMPEYRIVVQNSHVELAESKAEGLKRQAAMRQMGLDPSEVMLRKDNPHINYGANGATIDSLRDAVDKMDLTEGERNVVDTAIDHLAATTMRGSRLAGNLLRRNNIKGADADMIRALDQRRTASAVHQSYAEVMPEVERAMSDMREEVNTFEQSALYREFQQRVNGFGVQGFTGQLPWLLKTLQTIGYLKYLISPANLAMHLTHPTLVSIPEMAKMKGENIFSVHGRMLASYRMMGGILPTVGKSLMEAKAAWAFDHMPTDWVDSLIQQMKKNGASKELLQALQEGIETGHLHTTGYDFSPFYDTTNKFDRGMAKVRDMSQETTGAVDAINRVAVFTTAFKMARDHGMDYEAAVRYAKDTTSETLGLFSATNRARAMQLPIVRSVLQFKMVPMMIYNILARNTYNLIKGESTEARWAALKGLSGMMGTSFALAGLSGALPEPIRIGVTMGNMLGVNDSWQEQEDKLRQLTTDSFGAQFSGLMMDGLSGFAGANVSHRFGINDLMLFGEPKSNKPSDIMNWAYGLVGGVPGGLTGDTVSTMANIRDGNWEKALETGIPAKGITDLLKAGRLYMEGKPTAGGAPGMPPIGPWAAVVQAMGWQPESVARYGAAQAVLTERRAERTKFEAGIKQQFTGGDQVSAMDRLQAWNELHPESPINLSTLLKQERQQQGEEIMGTRVTPYNRQMLESMKERYLQ